MKRRMMLQAPFCSQPMRYALTRWAFMESQGINIVLSGDFGIVRPPKFHCLPKQELCVCLCVFVCGGFFQSCYTFA
jgi:hypothetical protein